MNNIIEYGIGREYLSSWTLNDALREIFQNYLDFGEYHIFEKEVRNDRVLVRIVNKYIPNQYEFLRIGKSIKSNNSIGKHGEGLKMAFLIFLRENLFIQVETNDKRILPKWNNTLLGETLSLHVIPIKNTCSNFHMEFTCPKDLYYLFKNNIIKSTDIIFKDNYHGSIVNKEKGNLYSGGLFICNQKNLKKAYDIPPDRLYLDRDRRIPGAWDVSYHTSKINEKQDEFNFVDQNYDDYKYTSIPTSKFKDIKPVEIKGQIEYVAKVIDEETKEEKEIVITNTNYKEQLKSSNFFSKAINKLKNFIASKLGVTDLLINFRNKYCNSDEARQDFDVILERLGINLNE